ncbi:MAG: SDR family NAD(P)-dependent oxidoreductase [Bacteroidota bacterium]
MKVLITGGTAGIGAAAAKAMAKVGHEVIVHGRSAKKCATVVEYIQAQGGSARAEMADFSSLNQVRAMADRLSHQGVDILLNNAGVWMNQEEVTENGFELTWQVNYLVPFLLTQRLLPSLLERSEPRVINISSSGHTAGRIHFDDINLREGYNGMTAYCQSKLAMVLFTQELARRTQGSSLIACSVDPGAVLTDLLANTGFNPPSARPAEEMVERWLPAVLKSGPKDSGGYFAPNGRLAKPSTQDQELALKLWALSENQIAI